MGVEASKRPQTVGEEIANAVSHGAALVASLALIPVLVTLALRRHDPWAVVGAAVFGGTMALLYGASTIYHATPHGSRAKLVWRKIDHSAIYLLIAGTYTPFALSAMRGALGWTVFFVIWGLAIFGVVLKIGPGLRYEKLSVALYVGMGWMGLIAARPMADALGYDGLYLVLAGGVVYTGGVVFYVRDRLKYRHFVWHLFVMGGTACHCWAVAAYALGATA